MKIEDARPDQARSAPSGPGWIQRRAQATSTAPASQPEDHRGHANSNRLSKPSDDISPGAPNIATGSEFRGARRSPRTRK